MSSIGEAEPVGGDLAEGDVVALAVRMAAGEHRDLAVAVHAHHRAFPAAVQAAALGEVAARPGAGLVDEAGEADAHQHAPLAQLRLLAPQRRVIRKRQQLVEQRRRIAGIIDAPARRRIRKVAARDQIAPAHLDDVDAEFARAAFEQAAR